MHIQPDFSPSRPWRTAIVRCLSILVALAIALIDVAGCQTPSRLVSPAQDEQPENARNMHIVVQKGHTAAITALSFSPDNNTFVSASADASLVLWEIATGRELITLRGHTDGVTGVTFAGNGRYLVSGGKDKRVLLWRVDQELPLRELGRFDHAVTAIGVSLDSERVIAGDARGNVKVWTVPGGRLAVDQKTHMQSNAAKRRLRERDRNRPQKYRGHAELAALTTMHFDTVEGKFEKHGLISAAAGVGFDGEDDHVAVDIDGLISGGRLWTTAVYRLRGTFDRIDHLAFTPDRRDILTANRDGSLTRFDLASRKETARFNGWGRDVVSITVPPGQDHVWVALKSGEVRRYDLDAGTLQKTIRMPDTATLSLAVSADGRHLLAGDRNGTVRLLDATSGRQMLLFRGRATPAADLRLAGNGRYLITGHTDRTVKVWDLAQASQARLWRDQEGALTGVVLLPETRTVLTADTGGELIVRELFSGAERIRRQAVAGGVEQVALSGDGKWIVTAGRDLSLKRWPADLQQGPLLLGTLDFFPACLESMGNGSRLAVATAGKIIEIWDLESGILEKTLRGHFRGVYSLAASPDGRYLYSGGGDHVIRKWDVATGQEVQAYHHHETPVVSLAFAPDGVHWYSGGADGRIMVWQTDRDEPVRSVQAHGGRVLAIRPAAGGSMIMTSGADAAVRKWSGDLSSEMVSFYGARDGEWAVVTPDGFYKTSPEGGGLVHWSTGDRSETFSFEQFERDTRRPDIVQARLNGDLTAGRPAPELGRPTAIDMDDHLGLVETGAPTYTVRVRLRGPAEVSVLRLFVNGRPDREVAIPGEGGEIEETVDLRFGSNRVTAIAYDVNGYSSNPRFVDVVALDARLHKPELTLLAVGIDTYPQMGTPWQLEYAASDARNLAQELQRQEGTHFERVRTRLLTNRDANRAGILTALDGLRQIPQDELAIIFMAGHGVRDRDGTFYFLTTGSTTEDPKREGVDWQTIARHLAEIHCRVILLLDACHAGSISTETVVPNNALAETFFNQHRGGVMVFSASKGRQFSMESASFGNGSGVFTHALVEALGAKSRIADSNRNRYVEFMEMVSYVTRRVNAITGGRQTPWLSRKEMLGDLPLAAVLDAAGP
jgi:WD40 repeat protein